MATHPRIRAAARLPAVLLAVGLFSTLIPIPAPASGPTDAGELEAFVDGLMVAHLEELETAGAVVSVVKDGALFFAKGYGYADKETGRKVDPRETLFRIGSVSKLFVWTSVMQLVEQGRLDLHTDVNEYLTDLRIPATFEAPVTLAHLMAHTPGFEDRVIGLFGTGEESLAPLSEILSRQLPTRVRPPGEVPSYSNHGTGIAAHIVETVAGQPWKDFIRERILEPLGMEHTTLNQPIPGDLASQMSQGYVFRGGRFEAQDFEWLPLAPVGAVSATATDMAAFMIAHLQLGRYGDRRILREETARRMHGELHRVDPAVNPMAYGFIDLSTHGVRIIGHGGDTFWFHTNLALFPEHGLGVFVSYNSQKAGSAGDKFQEAFVERYFPVVDEILTAPEDFAERAREFTGTYRRNRYAHTTLAKLSALVGSFKVASTADGELLALDRRFIEVAPRTFRERDGDRTLVFRQGEDGTLTHFYLADRPIIAFERVPVAERPGLHVTLLVMAVVMMIGTVIAWPSGWAVRKWFKVREPLAHRIPRRARLVLWLAALVLLTFVLGMAVVLADPIEIAKGNLRSIPLLLTLPLAGGLLALAALYFAIRVWWQKDGGQIGRIVYTLATLALLVFLWQLSVWNLLGFRY